MTKIQRKKQLCKAKRLYFDGTFKIVPKPFKQLFSVHSLILFGKQVKQIPLMYVLMSRRSARDYIAVFNQIKMILEPAKTFKFREAVMDFERAAWKPMKIVFPIIKFFGCGVNFCQAFFKRIQKFGLAVDYLSRFLCKLYVQTRTLRVSI